MARPRKHDGIVYRRQGTRFWWIRYWDRAGIRREEPTGSADWTEAQKKLRERVQARDENVLQIVRKGEELAFKQWVTQLLRQGDAKVFKKYSQMKLQMKREALQKLNRAANESAGVLGQVG